MEDGMQDVVGLYAAHRGAGSKNAAMAHQQAAAQNFQNAVLDITNLAQNARPGGSPYQNASAQPKPTLRPVRTEKEIAAQLAARMAELEAQAEQANLPEYPCVSCRFRDGSFCENALIRGIKHELMWTYDSQPTSPDAALCGPEKALWEPRLTLWERFIAWLEGYT